MKIAVIGGTGFVGSAVVAEALSRHHEVTSATRKATPTPGAQALALQLDDTQKIVELASNNDATIIAVPGGRGDDGSQVIAAHRSLIAALSEQAPSARIIVVGGAGSLLTQEGTRLVDTEGFPADYKPEALAFSQVLQDYRQAADSLNWTFVSPSPEFTTAERTGSYRVGGDQPAGEAISVADFAVALIDEAEKNTHSRERFTVAN